MDEILLSRVFALKVQADAVNACIEGMKATNEVCRLNGVHPTYSQNIFDECRDELLGLANELNDYGRG